MTINELVKWFLVVLFSGAAVLTIFEIGRPRKPMTLWWGVAVIAFDILLAVTIAIGWRT